MYPLEELKKKKHRLLSGYSVFENKKERTNVTTL
jgi:hypothetical protein